MLKLSLKILMKSITGLSIVNKNNQGFFFPTLMVYIMIFLILLAFMVYNNLANKIMIKSFEQEVYYEIAILKSKAYITNYLASDEPYRESCKQDKLTTNIEHMNLQIEGLCVISIDNDFYKKFRKNVLANDSQEITSMEYNNQVNFINEYVERQKIFLEPNFIEEHSEQILAYIVSKIPESEKVTDVLGELFNEYVIFKLETKLEDENSVKEGILIFYDYKKEKIRIIFHT